MTTHTMFNLRLLRCLTIGTRRLVAGATVHLDADTAVDLVLAGHAALVDGADITVLAEHVRGAQLPALQVARC